MTKQKPRTAHGTNAGYIAHFIGAYADGKACEECRLAHNAYRRKLAARKYIARVDALYIDATGTHRRVRALQRMGWTFEHIAAEAGAFGTSGRKWIHNLMKQKKVHINTARKVARAFEVLCMKEGPSERTRKLAISRNWPPPLAWDDIDDPNERPQGMKQKQYKKPKAA